MQKTLKACIASRAHPFRRAVHLENPELGSSLMHRLAAQSKPLGGFWEFFHKREN